MKKNDLNLNSKKIGCFENAEFEIVLKYNCPIQRKQYLVSLSYRERVKDLLKDLLEQKIIRYSNSLFTSPAFAIEKPNKELRLVVDFRDLNRNTEQLNYPFPEVFDQLMNLKDTQIYSQIDLKSGFYHIKISEKDKYKTVFVIMNEQYEFHRISID